MLGSAANGLAASRARALVPGAVFRFAVRAWFTLAACSSAPRRTAATDRPVVAHQLLLRKLALVGPSL